MIESLSKASQTIKSFINQLKAFQEQLSLIIILKFHISFQRLKLCQAPSCCSEKEKNVFDPLSKVRFPSAYTFNTLNG